MATDARVSLTIFPIASQKVLSFIRFVKLSSPINWLTLAPFQLKKL